LTNLTHLTLDNNQIVDISTVSGLTNLTHLTLDNNQIVDISTVSGLTDLVVLVLGDNQIVDISTLANLVNLTRLDLRENCLLLAPGSPDMLVIEALQRRGVNVTFDPQKPQDSTLGQAVPTVEKPDSDQECADPVASSLRELTRNGVAEFLSQHPVGGKAWVRFERKRGVSKDEIYAVASALKEQGYLQDYLRSPFGSRFAITWTTSKGSNYLRTPDMEEISEGYRGMCRDFDGFVYEQNIMVALYEKDDIRVTGIQQDGSYARVEYTWKRGRTTPIFDILHPVISSNMVEEFSAGERYAYEAYFSLYDDGWRVEICY
jgi:hypothetical protein